MILNNDNISIVKDQLAKCQNIGVKRQLEAELQILTYYSRQIIIKLHEQIEAVSSENIVWTEVS